MDISVMLALDASAFEKGLAAAEEALGRFKAGADAAAGALDPAASGMDAAAEAASAQAEAVSELAEAASGAAEAQQRQAGSANDAGKALQGAAAAAKMLPGPLGEVASGGLAAADAARRAGEAAKQFGLSMDAAMSATLVLALVAAVAKLVQTIRAARKAAEELARQTQQDNLAASVRTATQAYERLLEKMDAAAAKARGLSDAAAAGRDIDRQARLAEIERGRQLDILGGMDEETAGAKAEALRREAQFGWRRADSDAAVAAMRAEMEANDRKAAEAAAHQDALVRLSHGQEGDAAAQTLAAAAELERTVASLRDANEVLAARIAAEGRRGALIDAEEANASGTLAVEAKLRADAEAAAAAAAEAAAAEAARPAERAAREARGAPRSVMEEPPALAADRLARIGGFVGSGGTSDQARRQTDLLSGIAALARRIADRLDRSPEGPGAVLP